MKNKKTIIALLVIALLGGTYFYLKPAQAEKTVLNEEDIKAVITEEVKKGDLTVDVSATGILYSSKDVTVGAQASGQIKKLNIKIGDVVKKGDLLVEIDSTTQMNTLNTNKADLTSSIATLNSKKVSLKDAELKLNRQKEMFKNNAATQDTLETFQLNYEQAQAEVKIAEATVQSKQIALNTAEKNLSYTKIISPVNGTVVAIPVTEGQTVNAVQSAPTIAIISDLSQMKVKTQIAESDVNKVKPNMKLTFNILGGNKKYDGELESIDPAPTTISDNGTISSSSTSAIYYYGIFYVKNSGDFKPYMTANINIKAQEAKNALLVSSSAIYKKDGVNFVKVLNGNKLEEKQVKTGIDNKIKIEVLSGLNEGDKVVLSSDKAKATDMRRPMM